MWTTGATLALSLALLVLPVTPPPGAASDQLAWLRDHRVLHVLSWGTQMAWVCCFAGVMLGASLHAFRFGAGPAVLGVAAGILATGAFLTEKFIRLWALTLMARTVAGDGTSTMADVAARQFLIWEGGPPFVFVETLDYLGFWLYALFGLLLARPLWRARGPARVAGACFALYGVAYHALLLGSLFGPDPTLGERHIMNVGGLLAVAAVALLVSFRREAGTVLGEKGPA
jgi:hypothetical protein